MKLTEKQISFFTEDECSVKVKSVTESELILEDIKDLPELRIWVWKVYGELVDAVSFDIAQYVFDLGCELERATIEGNTLKFI